MIMERAIGEKFKEGDIELEVCKSVSVCDGCFYDWIPMYNWRMCKQSVMECPQAGYCHELDRKDNQWVIFKKV